MMHLIGENKISLEEATAIKSIAGNARGVTLVTDGAYVRRTFGEEGLQVLEEDLARVGCPVSYDKVKAMEWIPLSRRIMSLVAIRERFGSDLGDDVLRTMGRGAPTRSLVAKLFMKSFASAKLATARAPRYWLMHYDTGTLESEYLSDGVGVNLVIRDHDGHPAVCALQEGYYGGLFRLLMPDRSASIVVTETQCRCRGDDVHRFEIRWS